MTDQRRIAAVFDRILAANTFATKVVLLIAVLGFLDGRPEWLDIGLLYAMVSFISVIAVLRFFELGHFAPLDPEEQE